MDSEEVSKEEYEGSKEVSKEEYEGSKEKRVKRVLFVAPFFMTHKKSFSEVRGAAGCKGDRTTAYRKTSLLTQKSFSII
ncbi:hypothetical protein CEXT_574181 [Caerostris extrusa]|uniref:Uncharacterized protein n=1 Tax=Caerostris extrusa TaxID=172846 RepID=A0AAV4M7T5_CAEEX|nr:hypothetical protein CEXT_574181 [Caerostris extrusa]